MRRTISRRMTFEGQGIHSGKSSSVTLWPAEAGRGIAFKFGAPVYPVASARRTESRRNTVLRFPGGEEAATVEHLLSAIVGMGVDDIVVECSGGELPILDGSALPFANEMAGSGIMKIDGDAEHRAISSPIFVSSGESFAAALPALETSFCYIVDYPGTYIGTEMKEFRPSSGSYLDEIAPARTFALTTEIEALRAAGLVKGGSLDNALAVGPNGIEGGGRVRVEAEFAAHKLLDFIGDIAMLGLIPRARYLCSKGGHALHGALVARMRHLAAY